MGVTLIETVTKIKAAERKNSVWIGTRYVFRAEGTVWRARMIRVVKSYVNKIRSLEEVSLFCYS